MGFLYQAEFYCLHADKSLFILDHDVPKEPEYILYRSLTQTDDLQNYDANNVWRRVIECLLFRRLHEKIE